MAKADNDETPDYLFQPLNMAFNFTLDAAANRLNRKCIEYIDAETDGVVTKWLESDTVWCHPPISRVDSFARKASQEKCTSVLLLPARFDANWWRDYVTDFADHIIFLSKRVRWYGGNYAWEGYAVVIYNCVKLPDELRSLGLCVSTPHTPA